MMTPSTWSPSSNFRASSREQLSQPSQIAPMSRKTPSRCNLVTLPVTSAPTTRLSRARPLAPPVNADRGGVPWVAPACGLAGACAGAFAAPAPDLDGRGWLGVAAPLAPARGTAASAPSTSRRGSSRLSTIRPPPTDSTLMPWTSSPIWNSRASARGISSSASLSTPMSTKTPLGLTRFTKPSMKSPSAKRSMAPLAEASACGPDSPRLGLAAGVGLALALALPDAFALALGALRGLGAGVASAGSMASLGSSMDTVIQPFSKSTLSTRMPTISSPFLNFCASFRGMSRRASFTQPMSMNMPKRPTFRT
mmetsp:Transcript_44706/g.95264  ORF Transcript_44706/g.95264 Transcript_44706/m.95264 type:complete len:309 (-) Transcript_44706:443-1369(-)